MQSKIKQSKIQPKIAVVYMREGSDEHLLSLTTIKNELKKRKLNFSIIVRDKLVSGMIDNKDIVIVVGGDGTFLKASHYALNGQILFGINSDPKNKEGFFLNTYRKDFPKKLDLLLKGKAKILNLSRLEAKLDGETIPLALNEIFIGDPKPYRMSYYTLVIGKHSECHRTSGLLISTPSGTHAWAGSAGGEKLNLKSNKFEIVAREPYIRRLNKQKIFVKILDPKDEIEIISDMRRGIAVVDSISKEFNFSFDQTIKIKVSDKCLRMVV